MKKIVIKATSLVVISFSTVILITVIAHNENYHNSAKALNATNNQEVESSVFNLLVPADWKISFENNENIYFGKEQKDDIGGVIIKRLKFLDEEPVITENIIRRMLPNHIDINSQKKLDGFFTEAYLLNVTMNASAQRGGYFIGNWNYLVFIDNTKSTDKQVIAYALYLNTKYVTEQQAINITKTVKII